MTSAPAAASQALPALDTARVQATLVSEARATYAPGASITIVVGAAAVTPTSAMRLRVVGAYVSGADTLRLAMEADSLVFQVGRETQRATLADSMTVRVPGAGGVLEQEGRTMREGVKEIARCVTSATVDGTVDSPLRARTGSNSAPT